MISPELANERIRQLITLASRASEKGNTAETQQIIRQIETEAPQHPFSLNEAAQRLMRAGNFIGGRDLLERAIASEPTYVLGWLNLAAANYSLGFIADEKAALDKVLSIEPRNLRALLHSASLHERLQQTRTAAAIYRRAIESAARQRDLSPQTYQHLQHGKEVVANVDAELERSVSGRLEGLRQRYAFEPLRRFDKCIATVLKKQPIYRSKPSFMYFPELEELEFYDRDQFPWIHDIEAATDEIREEFIKVFSEDAGIEPYVTGLSPQDIWAELSDSRRWSVYYLWRAGLACPENLARCPKTAKVLERRPICNLWGSAPSAVFSILDAKTKIPPHTGVHNARLIVHLPLVIPEGCWFRVGSQTREWTPGEALVFDDTIEHEAWNGSNVPRSVLIFDTWNPRLSQPERELVTEFTTAVGEFYGQLPSYV